MRQRLSKMLLWTSFLTIKQIELSSEGVQGNGAPGITIGDWLVDQGLEAPKAPRVRSGMGAIRHQQRQSMAMRSSAAGMGGRGGGSAVASPSMGMSKQVGSFPMVSPIARVETPSSDRALQE